jgi:hypothetical protein
MTRKSDQYVHSRFRIRVSVEMFHLFTWMASVNCVDLDFFRTGILRMSLTAPYAISIILSVNSGNTFGFRDGHLKSTPVPQMASIGLMTSVRIHPTGFMYFADNSAHRIRTLDLVTLDVATLTGGGVAQLGLDDPLTPLQVVCPGEATIPGTADGTGTKAQFNIIIGMVATEVPAARSGLLWIADWQNTSVIQEPWRSKLRLHLFNTVCKFHSLDIHLCLVLCISVPSPASVGSIWSPTSLQLHCLFQAISLISPAVL